MNLVTWIRENAGMFQVTAAADPSEYSISYGEGTASVSWSVGDENYMLDLDFRNLSYESNVFHERAPDVRIRGYEGPFYFVIGEAVNLAVAMRACADANIEKAKECAIGGNTNGNIWCNYVGNLLYSILQGRGWSTLVP